MERKEHTLLNVVSTVALQVITLLSGFMVPKLILSAFGSEVNGLVASITQFLGYISLIEGGVTSVILANLYKPLATKDNEKVSAVVSTADAFFKKIALFFGIYQVILAIVYPFVIDSAFGWSYIALIVMILGLSTLIQYTLSLSWRLLLQADKRMYIAVFAQGVSVVLNLILTFIFIKFGSNIHIVKLVSGFAFFIQPLILNGYIRKNYSLNKKAKTDSVLLSQRWDGFGINVAAMIRSSAATVILSVTASLSTVSVFSVYTLVSNGLKSLITSISGGIIPTIGNAYAKGDKKTANNIFDMYEFVMFVVAFFCFTVAAVVMPYFALLYTKGINDANYNQPLLGIILMAAECIFCIRDPYVNMAYSAGHFKQVSKYAYIEAVITVVISAILALIWGVNGVAFGLLLSAVYRTVTQIWYLKKNILFRKASVFIKKFVCFTIASVVCAVVSYMLFAKPEITVFGWVFYAVKVSLVEIICLLIACFVSCKKELKTVLKIGDKS